MREKLEETTGAIFSVDETALHDGPGVRMVAYLKGCPLCCVWCHSPESISPAPEVVWYETKCTRCGTCIEVCPQGVRTFDLIPDEVRKRCKLCGACVESCPNGALEIKGREVCAGEIARYAVRLKPFFRRTGGGITISGGEPAGQPDFSYAIAALCKEAGIHVAVETSGFCKWDVLERLLHVVDLFLYDVKHADEESHRRCTGVSNAPGLENLGRLVKGGAEVVVRVPLIPEHNDSESEVAAIGRTAKELGVTRISLLPFNPATSGKYSWLRRECSIEGAKKQDRKYVVRLEESLSNMGMEVVRP